MKRILLLVFTLVMLAGAAHAAIAAPADSSKTPEQVGELYIMALLSGNADKVKDLADYLQLEGQQRDEFITAMSSMQDRSYDLRFNGFNGHITGEPAAATQAARALARAYILAMFQRSICHATGSAIHGYVALDAIVSYECVVPNAKKATASLNLARDAVEITPELGNKLAAAINAAPVDKTFSGKLYLEFDDSKHIWSDALDPVVEILIPIFDAIFDFEPDFISGH